MQNNDKNLDPPNSSFQFPSKRALFAGMALLIGLFLAFVISELVLRFMRQHIESSNHLDHGLILYDEQLGWRLAPNWKGWHRHYDFEVSYTTNPYGFRGDFDIERAQKGLRHAFVGDSFIFGFGVNDQETFIQLLNSQQMQANVYLNFGVPGFSTDQEYLLIQERVFYFSPDVIWLVTYLGNDLFDNELPFPLQANHAKPYFELSPDGLKLKNTPVPLKTKPEEQVRRDLTKISLEDSSQINSLAVRYLNRFELFRLLLLKLYRAPDFSNQFDDRFEYPLRLFMAIVQQIQEVCRQKKTKFHVVLMPGQSFLKKPNSLSAQFQDYLRRKIVENSKKIGVDVIDLALLLREHYQKHPGKKWFHPHEGHLTEEGHRIVGDILGSLGKL